MTNGAITSAMQNHNACIRIEVPHRSTLDAQRDQLIQPWHEHPGPILAEVENLRRLGIDRRDEILRIKAMEEDEPSTPTMIAAPRLVGGRSALARFVLRSTP